MRSLTVLNHTITDCTACPRLVTYRETVAQTKRRQYLEWTYWGKPIPGFGDPEAELYVLGLAPAA
ncbi:MAG: uracil-DNA glycosylase, partial [Pseudohongiella sp.]|nr:uracil-DNA glycosylase [Pseudohongiella sp.]